MPDLPLRSPLFVLIVEDLAGDFDLVMSELRRNGFEVRCKRVETEEQYREQLKAGPDIILADYVLPQFNAIRALKVLDESGLDIPLIVLTGVVSEERVVECMKQGAADYLLKDRLARLGPAIRRALEESDLRRERRLAEAALRKGNERFQHLVETTRVIPWELDPETWRFTYVGPQAVSLAGYPLEEWYREGFWMSRIHPEERARPFGPGECRDHDFICHMLTAGGLTLYLHCVAKTLTVDSGSPILRGFMVDITELKTTQQALARHAEALAVSNAELQQFACAASHDLQEPLRMVSFYTQLLAKRFKGKLDSDADAFIDYILEGARRMSDLIRRLLEYSRIGAGGPELSPTDCETIFRECMSNLRVALSESAATVTHDPLPTVVGDSLQLGQLIQNLLGNAIKFCGGKPPRVHVSARPRDEDWLFSVRDEGIGIEPEYFDAIFAIFQQLHGKDEYQGAGVGLAICRKIVERHKGRIWVESEPGTGSTFYFTIPTACKLEVEYAER
jgi:signal transduction histidine kinase/DNA-binding response OmpR family regulator